MHTEARQFVDWCVSTLGPFQGCSVLDVGSGDINGNNRHYFEKSTYLGCDVAPGPNVDIACPCHQLPFEPESFDVIISTECLEHDMHWRETLRKICDLLKPGGTFVMTCASTGRAEHGTLRSQAADSFTTRLDDTEWNEYYMNLTAEDVADAIPVREIFPIHGFHYQSESKDLYFYGIKAVPKFTG